MEFLESLTVLDEIENAVRFIRMSTLELEVSMNPATTEIGDIDTENDGIADISMPTTYNFCIESEQTQNTSNYIENLSSCENNDSLLHELQVCSMLFDEIQSELCKLTECQKKVMKYVMDQFKSKQLPIKIFITGGGGVGKSHLIRLLIE